MQIGSLTTGAGVATTFNREYVPAFIGIGAVNTDNPLQEFSITVAGTVVQQVTTQGHIQAMAKLLGESLLGADVKVGMVMKIAGDFIANQNCQIRLVNSGVTTPAVFAFAEGKTNASPVLAGQVTIQDADNQRFNGADFDYLIVPDTNLNYANYEFADGHTERLEPEEIDMLFNLYNQCDADGRLAGMHIVDNRRGNIKGVTIFASGGALKVTTVNLP